MTLPHYGSAVRLGEGGGILATGGPQGSQSNPGGGLGEITLWDLGPRHGTAP
jgi:hypothetical protein